MSAPNILMHSLSPELTLNNTTAEVNFSFAMNNFSISQASCLLFGSLTKNSIAVCCFLLPIRKSLIETTRQVGQF